MKALKKQAELERRTVASLIRFLIDRYLADPPKGVTQ